MGNRRGNGARLQGQFSWRMATRQLVQLNAGRVWVGDLGFHLFLGWLPLRPRRNGRSDSMRLNAPASWHGAPSPECLLAECSL
eukprot:4425821-Pyramimonas_sp.AAC.1